MVRVWWHMVVRWEVCDGGGSIGISGEDWGSDLVLAGV
jgi:hypothetical protein